MPSHRYSFLTLLVVIAAAFLGADLAAQPATVQAGRYDNGKMWMFENPPIDYLAETYDFHPDEAWFERARLSALRIIGCSAAFVSPNGLVATNHHCVRGRVSQVSQPGEHLLDNGFYAPSLDEERPIPGYYADQLIAIEDVTDEIYAALEGQETDAERAQAREDAFARVAERLRQEQAYDNIEVQVISLYNGGRYSAYIFRRYTDVRLVAAAELQLGFFGGDGDNFTYPRYALDFAFLRVYDENGEPMQTPNYFTWSQDGVEEADLIFVIGNPGSTTRLATVAQLEFLRDVQVKHTLRFLNNRLDAFRAFYEENPEEGEALGLRNTIFSISNSQKAYSGRQATLDDPMIIARRQDAERQFREAIENDAELREAYAGLFDRIAEIQQEKTALGAAYGAFRLLENQRFSSATLRRALYAYGYLTGLERGVSEEALAEAKQRVLGVMDGPRGLERRLLTVRFAEFLHHLPSHALTEAALHGRTPEEAATELLENSVLAGAESAAQALEAGTLTMEDPALQIMTHLVSEYADYQSAFAGLAAQEREFQGALGRARFDVYGTAVPPDATFSPRITDGIVKGYEYNGTVAPPYTTFFGLLDHHHSYGGHPDWTLPDRWVHPSKELDLSTPLNFVSTSDTIGGNSGSPAVTPELELVGLNFDRNIEGLSRDYIYLPERGRNIMVDVRAVREALDVMYDADRIVLELVSGRLVPTEEEADAVMQQ
ncbi:MAG: S46 family peptidase [Rhodothermales bacterium]